MAGIGFELRRYMKDASLLGVARAYGYAAIISSGPWVLSIFGIILIGFMQISHNAVDPAVAQFQISVTYLMALSLIFTGPIQLMFTRFFSDRIYAHQEATLVPNLHGVLTLTVALGGVIASVVAATLFTECDIVYKALMVSCFVTLAMTWIVVGVAGGIKDYRRILIAYVVGYAGVVGISSGLAKFGVDGLLVGFAVGHTVLFWLVHTAITRRYPTTTLVAFDFLDSRKVYITLGFTGLFYNLALWADKFLFWFNQTTSNAVIGPLRASELYDFPIFLAHIAIVPGMAIYLLRIETDFAERHAAYYQAIADGASLRTILQAKEAMILSIRRALLDIVKFQGFTVVVVFLTAESLLQWFGISPLYKMLLKVDVLATALQVLLLALFGILFYFDQRRLTLWLALFLTVSNIGLTIFSQLLGPAFYGYGFALALILTVTAALTALSYKLERLEYETFMLQ